MNGVDEVCLIKNPLDMILYPETDRAGSDQRPQNLIFFMVQGERSFDHNEGFEKYRSVALI